MISTILFFIHSALLLLFGVFVSYAFADIKLTRNSITTGLIISAITGVLQLAVLLIWDEPMVWKLYPLITHLPLAALMFKIYKRNILTITAAITSAYMCCQPQKWIGLFVGLISKNDIAEQLAQIIILIISAVLILRFAAPVVSDIYSRNTRGTVIFGIVPFVYYIFEYIFGIYTTLWSGRNSVSSEFFPFLISLMFFAFCIIYHKEYEQKADAERREQLVRISIKQQSKEIENIRKSNQETRILRHDMRHLLNALAMSVENEDKDTALNLIANYVSQLDAAAVHRYCDNDTINYVLSDFESRCKAAETKFNAVIDVSNLAVDEVILSSMISNALENALNAQEDLPPWKRKIDLMLRSFDNKLLLSVENSFKTAPVLVDGQPVSSKEGHGYGTKSIQYLAERLGGKTQFSVQDDRFVLRVIVIL